MSAEPSTAASTQDHGGSEDCDLDQTHTKTIRGKTKSTAVHVTALKDFVVLASYIVSSKRPKASMPASVMSLLNRAITLRKRFAAWYAKAVPSGASGSTAGHGHFTKVLEEVFQILKPLSPSDVDLLGCNQEASVQFNNLFENLNVETPSQAFLNAPDVKTEAKSSKKKFVAECDDSLQEAYLALRCVLEGIQYVRKVVTKVWRSFARNGWALIPCARTTYFAVRFVQRIELMLTERHEDAFRSDSEGQITVMDAAIVLFRAICHEKNVALFSNGADTWFNIEAYAEADRS